MILLYHKIHPENKTEWWVSPDAFYLQMLDLQNKKVVYLDEYNASDPKQVVITFDGVYENVFKYAAPILKHFNYPFELFIIGDRVGKDNKFDKTEPYAKFADRDTLTKLIDIGGRLQWHSKTHARLTDKTSYHVYDDELSIPSELKKLDENDFKWFAYPHGERNNLYQQEVQNRFNGALACDGGNNQDKYALKRLTVFESTRFQDSTVSLIIPCYNYGHFVAEAIESALLQTYPPDEVLFIDDASTDNSVEIARRYETQIRIEVNEKNLGVVENFRKAVDMTSGDYICFLGADNRFRSDYVEKTKTVLDSYPDVAIAHTYYALFGDRATIVGLESGAEPHPKFPEIFLKKFPDYIPNHDIRNGNYIHGSSMYRRIAYEQAGGYTEGGLQEDAFLFARILDLPVKAKLVADYVLEYRQHSAEQLNIGRTVQLENAYLRIEVRQLKSQFLDSSSQLAEREAELHEIKTSKAWRMMMFLRKIRVTLIPPNSLRAKVARSVYLSLKTLRNEGVIMLTQKQKRYLGRKFGVLPSGYQQWILNNEPKKGKLVEQRIESKNFEHKPLISIVMPVWNTPVKILEQTIESVINQTYENWELCIADGNSSPKVHRVLSSWVKRDPRIKIDFLKENKGIAINSNEAIALTQGEFIAFLDHDDLLAPFALFEVVKKLQEDKGIDLIYSDEDKVNEKDERLEPFFKPDFSPDYLRGVNYMTHFLVIRKSLGDKLGWLREGYEGAQDYDLILRAGEKAKKIAHISKILYHWRVSSTSTAGGAGAKPHANISGKKALREHLQRTDQLAQVENGYSPTLYRVCYRYQPSPLISIIIPTQDHADDLEKCINSILEKTTYTKYEIILVENGSREQRTFELYKKLEKESRVRILKWEQSFNYSLVNNWAVMQAKGEIVLFLNNDIEVIVENWLEEMVQFAVRPDVGAVGAKLYYPDGTIQHGGVILGISGIAGHSHRYFPGEHPGYFGQLVLPHNVSAVTAACLMVKKQIFEDVSGFDESYPLAFGDVDLCLRILDKGYLNVWTPYAELTHYESKTRGSEKTVEQQERFLKEITFFKKRWSKLLEKGDPYYNPNLTLESEDFSIGTNKSLG